MANFFEEREIRSMIAQELARRIDYIIEAKIGELKTLLERKIQDGLLEELSRQIRQENDRKFERLDALNTIVEQLQVLFATNRPTT